MGGQGSFRQLVEPARPSVHSDAGSSAGRMQSPRWHSFLPGMFR